MTEAAGIGQIPLSEKTAGDVAIIDDDAASSLPLRVVLQGRGLNVTTWRHPAEAISALKHRPPDAIVLALPSGLAAAQESISVLRLHLAAVPVVGVVQAASDRAVAQRVGCANWVVRPVQPEQLAGIVARAIATNVTRSPEGSQLPPVLAGTSKAAQDVLDLMARVAPLRISTLFVGEPGSGREAAARHVHALSRRRQRRFVAVQCNAQDWTARELFEPAGRATNGSAPPRQSLFEEAHLGTLYLHEVSALPMECQVRVFHVCQDRRFRQADTGSEIEADIRLIAATSIDLAEAVELGRFYAGLYFRLNVVPIVIAPLRERREDIPVIAEACRARFAAENGVEPPRIPSSVQERMMTYDWPGNTRQLEQFVERALVIHAGHDSITFDPPSSPPRETAAPWRPPSQEWTLERVEKDYIDWVLKRTRGHQGEAARILGISRRTLYRRLRDGPEAR